MRMRLLSSLVLLAGLVLVVSGFVEPGVPGPVGAVGPSVAGVVRPVGSSVPVDTLTYVWRSSTSIPAAAADSGWGYTAGEMDTVFTDSDGTFMRYGAVRKSVPDTLYWNALGLYSSTRVEDDAPIAGIVSFLWYDLSKLPADVKIESAHIVASGIDYGNITVGAGGYIAARLDTVAADLAMLDSSSPRADPRYFNMSYNRIDEDANTLWVPDLDDRDDWHDFGPRSDTVWTDTVVGGSGTSQDAGLFRLEVTSAVQSFVDSGREMNGPFVVYGVNTGVAVTYSAGADANYDNGQPYLIVEFSTRRGTVEWGPSRVPLNVHFDDAVAAVEPHIAKLDSAGGKASLAIHALGVSTGGGGASRWNAAEINALLAQGHKLVYHSNFHGDPSDYSLIGHADCDSLSYDINPDHPTDGLHDKLGIAWQSPRTFAWPTHKLSAALVDSLLEYGFIGARGGPDGTASAGNAWSCNGVDAGEASSLLRWGADSNLYAVSIIGSIEDVVGNAAATPTAAEVKEGFDDLLDIAATNKAPMIFYVHTDKAGSTHTNAKIDADEFRWMVNTALAHGVVELDTFSDILTEYRAAHVSKGSGIWGPQ